MAQTPGVWSALEEWMRHRLRAIQLKHWRHGLTIYRELRALGASAETARQVAANNRCWWRNSDRALKRVLTISECGPQPVDMFAPTSPEIRRSLSDQSSL
jgi:RNA-directed DNA polymerase